MKKVVLRNFTKFKGKYLCLILFCNKVFSLLNNRPYHRCFPVNFAKFLITAFLQNTSARLLLNVQLVLTNFEKGYHPPIPTSFSLCFLFKTPPQFFIEASHNSFHWCTQKHALWCQICHGQILKLMQSFNDCSRGKNSDRKL